MEVPKCPVRTVRIPVLHALSCCSGVEERSPGPGRVPCLRNQINAKKKTRNKHKLRNKEIMGKLTREKEEKKGEKRRREEKAWNGK